MKAAAVLAILEAAYQVEASEEAWLVGVLGAARPSLDLGLGVAGYFTQVGGPGEIRNWGHLGDLGGDVRRFYDEVLETVGPEPMRQLHMTGPFGSTTHLAGRPCASDTPGASMAVGVMGLDASGRGVTLASWSPPGRVVEPSSEARAFWGRVAPHLATAARLRHKLGAATPEPEAVLDPGGRVLHAAGDARERLARAALREAAVRVDRARASRAKVETGETLALWRCMVDRRWTIVDRFERDGRRYVVAYPNPPEARVLLESLTPRERATAMAAALGHSNKVIAYELGISESTVSTLLTRAARKLGAASRVELVRALRQASPADDVVDHPR